MRSIINEFDGKYRFLSNFYECKVEFEGIMFNSSEAAFQAAKIKYIDDNDTIEARKKFVNVTPSESKKMGRHCDIRENWDQIRDSIMLAIVRDKFNRSTELALELIKTRDSILIEGTKWHDNYWGNCTCSKCNKKFGLNKLGNILMQVREELIAEGA